MLRNYNNTLIYKIVCNDLTITDVYVGHTTDFTKRKYRHKSNCNNETDAKYNLKVYKMIRDNGGWDNWVMVEVEKYPCNDSNEARARERYWYEILNANMNSANPSRSEKEYREDNKERILQRDKEYRDANKDKMKQYKKDNKEKYKIKDKKYRDANKDKIKDYQETNKIKIKAQRKIRDESNKEVLSTKYKEFYNANKEYNINRAKEYYNTNKDAINARRKELRRVKKTLEINNNSLDII